MSDKGWICIGTHEGQLLYFNTSDKTYAVFQGERMRTLTSEELIQKSKERRSAAGRTPDSNL